MSEDKDMEDKDMEGAFRGPGVYAPTGDESWSYGLASSPVFPGGFRLDPATQGEVDHVEAHYRAGERHEAEIEQAPPARVDDFERCWTVRAGNGEIVGYFGVMPVCPASFLSRTRGFCFMSCEAAERHKVAFVKATRPAFAWVASQCPPWTERFVTWPLESYARSVRWQLRVLGMRIVGHSPAPAGERYVVMEKTRKEIGSWDLGRHS